MSTALPPGNWCVPTAERIAPLPSGERGPLQRLLIRVARIKAKSAHDLNVFVALARLGSIFLPYTLFLYKILTKGRISRVDKERIILRVAWRCGCVYEWGHHRQMALGLGILEAEILSLARVDEPAWDARLRSFVRAADELVERRQVSDESWQLLRSHLSDNQAVEFCMLVGHYVMVAGTINAVGVRLEPGYLTDHS
jgi:alkylhydroperoxidase family enzyme